MRLKSIKLAGFKSFVDPTTVPFSSNMTAVVGPNGCGKSNIIDAVRWVMGESSAKNLRGESMTDVIFNGSNARKPVGQASIELIFDNADATAPGEFARFNEISVRRRVSRDNQSEYFLNGTRCRRRDITELFLGTGLGPRSYAIIEQGMISRLIDARPEDLRLYIEEAAGISKYKERRKETESRMRRTQENLDRLADLRDELGRQLGHLQRQAQAAEKYKAYKQEERQKKAEMAAMRWQSLDQALQLGREAVRESELTQEKLLAERTHAEALLEQLRDQQHDASDQFNRVQASYYEVGAAIARVEQTLAHQKERIQRLAEEAQQLQSEEAELTMALQQDQLQLENLEADLLEAEPALALALAQAESTQSLLADAESNMAQWQQDWERFTHQSADSRQQAEVSQTRIRNREDALQKLAARQRRLQDEKDLLSRQIGQDELSGLREQCLQLGEARDALLAQSDAVTLDLEQQRAQLAEAEADLNRLRQSYQAARGALASQQTLLEAQLGDQDAALQAWLQHNGLSSQVPLIRRLRVEAGWENAVEWMLGGLAHGVLVPSLDVALREYTTQTTQQTTQQTSESLPNGLALLEAPSHEGARDGLLKLLLNTEDADAAGAPLLLSRIRPVDSLAQALAERHTLDAATSLVTPEGIWVGANWLRMPPAGQAAEGVIATQRKVEALAQQVATLAGQEAELAQSVAQHRQGLLQLEQTRESLRRQVSDAEQQLSRAQAEASAMAARSEQIRVRILRLDEEFAELAGQILEEEADLSETREVWHAAMQALEADADQREQLLAARDQQREGLDLLRQSARHDRDQAHQHQLTLQDLLNQRNGLRQACERLAGQAERLQARSLQLRDDREAAIEPLEALALSLETQLERQLIEESALTQARQQLEENDRQLRETEQGRHRLEQQQQQVRSQLERQRMETQALEIRGSGYLAQLAEMQVTLHEILQGLPAEAAEQDWETALQQLEARIQRLGPINLAAIDEYTAQSTRKVYLDQQHQDLADAMETLENAIRKIDRETRQRFKETYDQVNQSLQELFPKVFGGGSAYLALTGEDLLETGVTIMARPPGKKNSTIHLLSGGEKALTAIALVFSIFRLKPAPFCMLDEVDAPLDDANVGRYASLVKSMSQQVQFIYITHNKIAMEVADQLMGVTMHEPGVSRLVSVNVEEAAALAVV